MASKDAEIRHNYDHMGEIKTQVVVARTFHVFPRIEPEEHLGTVMCSCDPSVKDIQVGAKTYRLVAHKEFEDE